jgi:hypothetical protein
MTLTKDLVPTGKDIFVKGENIINFDRHLVIN